MRNMTDMESALVDIIICLLNKYTDGEIITLSADDLLTHKKILETTISSDIEEIQLRLVDSTTEATVDRSWVKFCRGMVVDDYVV